MDDPKATNFAKELRMRGLTSEEIDRRFHKITPATFEEVFGQEQV